MLEIIDALAEQSSGDANRERCGDPGGAAVPLSSVKLLAPITIPVRCGRRRRIITRTEPKWSNEWATRTSEIKSKDELMAEFFLKTDLVDHRSRRDHYSSEDFQAGRL